MASLRRRPPSVETHRRRGGKVQMSAGSSAGGSQFRMNAMSHGWQPQFGLLTSLPLVPCPRCGDRVLELRMGDGSVFFKCRQNDQDVPAALRKCKFYKLPDEYEGVLVNRGYGHLIGARTTHHLNVIWNAINYRNSSTSCIISFYNSAHCSHHLIVLLYFLCPLIFIP